MARVHRGLALALVLISAFGQSALACPSDLDPTFGEAGIAKRPPTESKARFYQPVVQSDGGILVPATWNGNAAVLRYLSDGTVDRAFGDDGVATIAHPGAFYSLDVQSDGRIVAAGVVEIGDGDLATHALVLARFGEGGQLDTSFGVDGAVVLDDAPGFDASTFGVVVRSDGVIVATRLFPRSSPPGVPMSSLLFFTPEGELDPDFGMDGILAVDVGPRGDVLTGIVRLDDDSVLLGGFLNKDYQTNFDVDAWVIKVKADGSLDPAFGSGGVSVARSRPAEVVDGIRVDDAGRIYVSGELESRSGETQGMFVRRFLPNGERDPEYGHRGRAAIRFLHRVSAGGFDVTPDGRAVVPVRRHEWNQRGGLLVRFAPDGRRDRTFGRNGIKRQKLGPFTEFLSVTAQPDARLLVVGQTVISDDNLFTRLLLRLDGGTWDGVEQCVIGCGDGRIMIGEQCDDGNVASGDGCSAMCLAE